MPTTMSIAPSATPFFTSRVSAAPTMRDSWPTPTGRPAKRSRKFFVCWRASRVVGATTAVCLPLIAAAKAARSATSVLPKPTSPQTSRSIGPAGGEIVERRLDRALLVRRLLVGKAGAEFVVEAFRDGEARRGVRHPLGGDADELAGHLAHALLQPRLARLPACSAEPVELAGLRAVARQELEIFDRQGTAGRRRRSEARGSRAARPRPRSSEGRRSARRRGRYGRRDRRR